MVENEPESHGHEAGVDFLLESRLAEWEVVRDWLRPGRTMGMGEGGRHDEEGEGGVKVRGGRIKMVWR